MLKKSLFINKKEYGIFNPYIIAEIGVNHEGSIENALQLIDAASSSGAHAVKFQTYKAATLAAKDFSPAYWDVTKENTKSQYELFSKYDSFGEDDYRILANYANRCGVDFLSTPFDLESVEFLDSLVPAFKIASADITNIPLIRAIAKKNKPIFLSVGASYYSEIHTALEELLNFGAREITLLHCVLNYPTKETNANVLAIQNLYENFGEIASIGYSDHVPPRLSGRMPSIELAISFGAIVIEKHFTLDKNLTGNDHYHSMDSDDLRKLIDWITEYFVLVGSGDPDIEIQFSARENARRRICTKTEIKKGMKIQEDNLIPLRSSIGIEVQQWDKILGRKVRHDLPSGVPISEEDLVIPRNRLMKKFHG